jgi:hypothetical protein
MILKVRRIVFHIVMKLRDIDPLEPRKVNPFGSKVRRKSQN